MIEFYYYLMELKFISYIYMLCIPIKVNFIEFHVMLFGIANIEMS